MAPSPTPKRDHGDRSFFGFEARAKRSWCGRRDLNPHGPCGPTDFRTRLRLSPPLAILPRFGVWIIPSRCPGRFRDVRCCPSSLYTFPARLDRASDRTFKSFASVDFATGHIVCNECSTKVHWTPHLALFRQGRHESVNKSQMPMTV